MAELKIPAGYKLIPEELYNSLMALMSQKPAAVQETPDAKNKKYYKVVVPVVHLGHNKLTLHKGDVVEYVPGDYFKFGGSKHNNIESFTTILRGQRNGSIKNPFLVEVSESALQGNEASDDLYDDQVARISMEEDAEPNNEVVQIAKKRRPAPVETEPDTDIEDMDIESRRRFIHDNGVERLETSVKTASGFQVEARETPDDIEVIPPLRNADKSVATIPGPPADERAMSADEMSHQQGRARARRNLK